MQRRVAAREHRRLARPGFVTQCPNFIVVVACTAIVSSGNDSCQSTCESYVQPYSKPFDSACWISSRKRLVRRVGQDGDAEAQSHVGLSFARSESAIIDARLRVGAKREAARLRASAAIAAKARRPSPGSSNASPASGVPTRIVRTAQALTSAIAAPGASGRSALRGREDHGERQARDEPEDERAERRDRERSAECEQRGRPPRCRRARPPTSAARRRAGEQPSDRACEDADEEDEPAGEARCGRARSLALEERDDPVPCDDGEPEGRCLQDADRKQACGRGAPSARRARCAAGRLRRAWGGRRGPRGAARAPVRRTPARRVGERRHDHEREAAPGHRRAAVEALQRGAASTRTDEVEARRRSRRPSRVRRSRARRARARRRRRRGAARFRRPPRRSRASATRASPKRSAPRPAGSCTARCVTKSAVVEQADRGERDAVVRGERVGDRADVRDVPRQAPADREAATTRDRRRAALGRDPSSRPPPSATQAIVFDASRSSAATASSRCSSFVSSSFVCERPRRLWTKSITVGTPARETSAASCSGPDGSRCAVPATSLDRLLAEAEERLVEEDRLDRPDPLPRRRRSTPRPRSARSPPSPAASIEASFAARRGGAGRAAAPRSRRRR